MRPTPALFDIAKRAVAVDERTGRHPTDGPASARAASPRLLRPTSQARVAFPSLDALRLFRRRRHVKPASTSTPADFGAASRAPCDATCHWVVPQLAGSFFVVCPDLRGYGQSTLPPDAPEYAQSSKRARTSCPLVTAACG